MTPLNPKVCKICEDGADSVHFGALSCKACAAFFRRVVGGRQKVVKRCGGGCSTKTRQRKLCGSCRFEKCLKAGMRKELVESKTPEQPPLQSNLLEKLQEAYDHLEALRSVTFEKQQRDVIKVCNYKEMDKILFMDMKLIHQSLIKFFETKTQLEDKNQRSLLAAHFIIPFLVMHGAYKWTHDSLFHLPNGEFIDLACLEEYYQVTESPGDEKARQSKLMLEPYWKMNAKVLQPHFSEVKLDKIEFLSLSALLYWDFGLDGQTDECIEVCQKLRFEVLSELTRYEKEKEREEDHSLRVGQIMIILQTMQKSMGILYEFKEVARFFDLYGKDTPFFDVM